MTDSRMVTRFFVALAVLIAALVAVAALGVGGLRSVGRANDQVFNDNLRTALATSRVARDIDRAEMLGLKVAAAPDSLAAERLRTQLLHTAVWGSRPTTRSPDCPTSAPSRTRSSAWSPRRRGRSARSPRCSSTSTTSSSSTTSTVTIAAMRSSLQ
jgi:hypothetical protein